MRLTWLPAACRGAVELHGISLACLRIELEFAYRLSGELYLPILNFVFRVLARAPVHSPALPFPE
eukprot:14341280-Alexandrium_andersonii.AAC.1